MKTEEITLIKSKHNAAIIAPAGHGKTEMITDLVDKLPGIKLVLTHTNAGVAALAKRFNKKNVNGEKYYLSTISSFCMKWTDAYPSTAGIRPDMKVTEKDFYSEIHIGTARIFTHSWARDIIAKTYNCVIVDEYQDCVLAQHQIFVELNKTVPVYVLGDPLQAIFGFKESLVSWKDICFDVLENEIDTYPWRWENTNPDLGQYLNDVRKELLPGLEKKEIRLSTIPNQTSVFRINPADIHGSVIYDITKKYDSVIYIAKWETDTRAFAKSSGGIFQHDEKQNLDILYNFAARLDVDDAVTRGRALFEFISECASGVPSELGSYEKHIISGDYDFRRIKKHPEFGKRMTRFRETNSYDSMLRILEWVKACKDLRLHRRELFSEMQRSIRRARDNQKTILKAAQEIRMIPGNQSKYSNFKRLSSRTLLSKGLEFDCVIIDLSKVNTGWGNSNRYSVTEMYVAMTRAMKAIYFITDEDSVLLSAPQGI